MTQRRYDPELVELHKLVHGAMGHISVGLELRRISLSTLRNAANALQYAAVALHKRADAGESILRERKGT